MKNNNHSDGNTRSIRVVATNWRYSLMVKPISEEAAMLLPPVRTPSCFIIT